MSTTNKRKWVIASLAATLVAGSTIGIAVAHERGDRAERFARMLELSPEQQTQMQSLWEQKMEARDAKQAQSPRGAMMALDPRSDSFQADVDKLIEQAQTRVEERIRQHAQMREQMSEILTDAQYDKLQTMMAKRGEHYGKSFESYHGGDKGWGRHHDGDGRNCR
jgi:Spy/CpxP family protein refolding chaperone